MHFSTHRLQCQAICINDDTCTSPRRMSLSLLIKHLKERSSSSQNTYMHMAAYEFFKICLKIDMDDNWRLVHITEQFSTC